MTIGTRTAGAWAAGSTSISTNLPTSVAAGDMMVLFVGCKPYNATIADISGWTRLGTQQTNGTTGASTDAGSVAWTVFYRQFQNGDTAPSVSITSGNTALACIFGFTKTESAWATPTAYFGADTSSGTGYSITAASSSGLLKAGDYLCSGTILSGNDADLNSPTCSATGATIGTVTQAPGTNGSTNTGTDCRAGGFYAPVTAGISSADAVVGWTLSANQTGGTALVRVRETNQTVAPSTGTLRTVGQEPTVTVPVTNTEVSPSVGTLRLVGQTPTTRLVDSWIALVPGINTWAPRYQIGGTDVSPSVGSLLFVGQQPTLGAGADVTVTPTVGTLRLIAQQPTVTQDWTAAPSAGTFRFVGQQPDIDQTWSASPETGTFRLVGQQPTVEQDWTVAPTAGVLVFVGQDPTVELTQNLYASPEAGTLRVQGQQPSVAQDWTAAPTAGALRFVGQQPAVSAGDNRVAQPSSGTFRITGLAPTVSQTWSASPTVGTVRLVGQQPTVSQTWSASPSAGSFRLVGQQPTVDTGANVTASPEAGLLRFDGQQPTTEQAGAWTITPASGLLRFAGNAPQIIVPGLDVEVEQPSGGWAAYNQSVLDRTERIRREIEDERERQELADRLEAELRREGVLADSEAERLRLAALAAQYQDTELPNRVLRALRYAQRAETDLAIELALREFRRMQEEEELAVLMALVLD